MRAAKKTYSGPPLLTAKAIKEENDRQTKLKSQFNREAAEWTVVRKRARIAYFKHSNSEQETNLMNADFDIIETSMENDTLKEAITQKVAEASNYAKLKERMASTLSNNNQATENGN